MLEFTVPPLVTVPQVGGVADTVFETAANTPDLVLLGRKVGAEWQDVTAGEFRAQVLAVAKGLLAEGIRFGDRVAIMSRTRYEWTLLDFALWTVGAQPVPVYPTASTEQLGWILYDTAAVGCVVENEDQAMTLGAVIDQLPALGRIWQLDSGAVDELTAAGRRVNEDVAHRHRMAVTPDAVATITYSWGSIDRPKGCLITHSNLMAECDNIIARWPQVFRSGDGEQAATLLFLPLSQVFGRMVEVAALRGGVRLGHQPDLATKALLPELRAFRPTFLVGVPHVFERIFRTARDQAAAGGRLAAFDKAVDVAVRYAEAAERRAFGQGPGPSASLRLQHQVNDKLVYSRLREVLGGRVRHAMSGGAAMDRRLGLFFAGAGVMIYEGYGLAESTAAAVANAPGKSRFGTVGQPVPGMSVRIAEDGEVLLRGGQIFAGYLNDGHATRQVLHDGWLATGDIGALDEDGYLTITGHKKEVVITAGGKSVSPATLEERVRSHPLVAHCLVVGNDRPFVAALMTLDHQAIEGWLALRGKPALDVGELINDPDLVAEVRRAVNAANTLVSTAESIRSFSVLASSFTVENGLLDPAFKIRRSAVEEAYAEEIDALYERPH